MKNGSDAPRDDDQTLLAYARGEMSDERGRQLEARMIRNSPLRDRYRAATAGHFPDIPNYTVLQQIGKGGFGVVYKAIHHSKERIEAVKVLFSRAPTLAGYFKNEVHLVARLRHENVATLYEAQLDEPPFHYAMEFVDGQRFNEYVRTQRIPLPRRLQIVRTIAGALSYAHRENVVHRDIKPQNVLIDAHGVPHLVDFGIALRLNPDAPGEPATGDRPVGTQGYIAPEQAAGQAVDRRADIYALGALLFFAVTGDPARQATDARHVTQRLAAADIARREDLAAIIARCVQADPADRYGSCDEFVQDLDAYLAGRPVRAREDATALEHLIVAAQLVSRNYPLGVMTLIVGVVTATLSLLFYQANAQHVEFGGRGDQTMIVALGESTIAAIDEGRIGADVPGLSGWNEASWRMLHGRFMEKLNACRPLVLVWDYEAPSCYPEYDPMFVAGAQSATYPVIIGASEFDQNGVPKLCPELSSAVDGVGALHVANPDYARDQFEVAYCIQRGFEPPIPSLAVAAYAASVFPNCNPVLQLDPERLLLHVRYKNRNPTEDGSWWQTIEHQLPILRVVTVPADKPSLTRYLRVGDMVANARVNARPTSYWENPARKIMYEDVMTADAEQLRRWFDGKAVIVGSYRPLRDLHRLRSGEYVRGVQIQADSLDALLADIRISRVTAWSLVTRGVPWALLGAFLIRLIPARKWRSLRFSTLCTTFFVLLGLVVGLRTAATVGLPWIRELALGASTFTVCAALCFLAKAHRERLLQLAPTDVLLRTATEGPDTTVMAEQS